MLVNASTTEQDVDRTYWVYILASRIDGTLYVGVTNSLERRTAEHRAKATPGFTRDYGVDRLVFFRGFGDVQDAIRFEKQLKRWRRAWKIRLIEGQSTLGGSLSRDDGSAAAASGLAGADGWRALSWMGPGLSPVAKTWMTRGRLSGPAQGKRAGPCGPALQLSNV